MGIKSAIEWTDATWSPLRVRVKTNAADIARANGYASLVQIAEKMVGHVGPHCEHVSDGCKFCYSCTGNERCLPHNGTGLPFDRRSRDLVESFVDLKILKWPLRWKAPRKIFVENQSDLFGEWIPDEHIDLVFAVMALCPQHTFQVLTKRPQRLLKWATREYHPGSINDWIAFMTNKLTREMFGDTLHGLKIDYVVRPHILASMPLSNVVLGVSAEDQPSANERILPLLQTPAAVRFVSYEPALGGVDFTRIEHEPEGSGGTCFINSLTGTFLTVGGGGRIGHIDWVIAGSESGRGARPAHPQWFEDVRDQCQAAGVRFFFKQWGAYGAVTHDDRHGVIVPNERRRIWVHPDGSTAKSGETPRDFAWPMIQMSKKASGRLLDGRTWDEFPSA